VPDFQSGWVDPERRSIAVLPFLNMSGDAEQEYFSDGITEDIITELSRFKNLFVISRNSSFHFKGRTAKAGEIGRELSAKYVVEGSVRRAGGRVRITAQLIEAASDSHVWAERYDRELEDIFQVQDDVVRAIASVIPGELDRRSLEQTRRKPPENLTAYECELRGRWAFSHGSEGIAQAVAWYNRAIEADSNYAIALAGLAQAMAYGVFMLGTPAADAFAEASALAARAVGLDDRNPEILRCAGYVNLLRGENQTAKSYVERAIELNPNDHLIMQTLGEVLAYGGQLQEALAWFSKSSTLVPYSPDDRRLDLLCEVYYMLGEYEKVRQLTNDFEFLPNYCPIAAACAQLGDVEGAEAAKAKFLSLFSLADATKMIASHLQMCARPEDRDHWIDGYRKAGLPV
jgi:adenylate cyclase